jgi:N-acetylneuraminic acid mutarotase
MKNISLRAGRFMALALVITGLGLGSCKKSDTTTVYGNWVRSSTYSGPIRSEAVSFVINNVAYAGTGFNPTNPPANTNGVFNDFYAFDPSKGGWLQVTSMPAAAGVRYAAVAFTANGKGYVAGGNNGSGTYLSDVWLFNPDSTTTVGTTTTIGKWRQVKSMPVALSGAVAGSINNIGYVGSGYDGSNNTNIFYQYNPTTNTWSRLSAAFGGDKRRGAFSFVVNNQFYVGGGSNNSANVTDVFSYDPSVAGGKWNTKRLLANVNNSNASYDYSAVARAQAVGFSVGDKGYVTVGGSTLQSCYEYNAADDSWTLKNPFIGAARNNAVGFGIGNNGYVGLGTNGSTRLDDFYSFAPNDAQQ